MSKFYVTEFSAKQSVTIQTDNTPCLKKVFHPTTNNNFNSNSSNFWYKYEWANMSSKGCLIFHFTCLVYLPYLVKIMNLASNCTHPQCYNIICETEINRKILLCFIALLGPFHGAIAVASVTRCHCRRRWCRGHRCADGARQYCWRHLVNGREAARSSEWAQHFSNASCFTYLSCNFQLGRTEITSVASVSRNSDLVMTGSLQQNVTEAANKWRKWLSASVCADGQHFEHLLWASHENEKKS